MTLINLSHFKKIIIFSVFLLLIIPISTNAIEGIEDECVYEYYDKDVKEEKLDYYQQQVNVYGAYVQECRQDYSAGTCYEIWGIYIDYYNGCIDDAELVAPISCQRFAEYNFDSKQCACNVAYLEIDGQCLYQVDYCIELHGILYTYDTQTSSCIENPYITDQALNEYCVDTYGENALFSLSFHLV